MKKIVFLLLILIFLPGCEKNKEFSFEEDFKVKVIKDKKCKNEFKTKEYYWTENKKLFLVCIEDIELYNKNSSIILNEYLSSEKEDLTNVIDKLTEKIEYSSTMYDGGTKIYQNKKSTKDVKGGITLVICNTLEGNNDIYVGNGDMDTSLGFNSKGMCK